MSTTVQQWGNSLGVRIPKAIAEQVRLSRGTPVEFDTSGGALTIRPKRRRRQRRTLDQILAKVKRRSPHAALDRDARGGQEIL